MLLRKPLRQAFDILLTPLPDTNIYAYTADAVDGIKNPTRPSKLICGIFLMATVVFQAFSKLSLTLLRLPIRAFKLLL